MSLTVLYDKIFINDTQVILSMILFMRLYINLFSGLLWDLLICSFVTLTGKSLFYFLLRLCSAKGKYKIVQNCDCKCFVFSSLPHVKCVRSKLAGTLTSNTYRKNGNFNSVVIFVTFSSNAELTPFCQLNCDICSRLTAVKINIIMIFMVINCKVSSIKVMLSFLGVVVESGLSCPVCLMRVVVVDLSLEAWLLRLMINRVLTLLFILVYWSWNVCKVPTYFTNTVMKFIVH